MPRLRVSVESQCWSDISTLLFTSNSVELIGILSTSVKMGQVIVVALQPKMTTSLTKPQLVSENTDRDRTECEPVTSSSSSTSDTTEETSHNVTWWILQVQSKFNRKPLTRMQTNLLQNKHKSWITNQKVCPALGILFGFPFLLSMTFKGRVMGNDYGWYSQSSDCP